MASGQPVRISLLVNARRAVQGFAQTARAAIGMQKRLQVASKETAIFTRVAATAAAKATLLAAALAAISPVVLKTAQALAPLAGFLVAVPALALAGAAAFGTFKLATLGVGDAIGAAFANDAKKFQEALKKLSPNAKRVTRDVAALVKPIEALRKSVQDAFFAPLLGQLKPLAQQVLPILGNLLPPIAAALGNVGRKFAEAALKGKLLNGIHAVLRQTATLINNASRAVAPLSNAFAILFQVGSTFLPRLGTGIADLATKFDRFISNAAATGKLQGWLEGAITAAKNLGGIFSNVKSIVSTVFEPITGDKDILKTVREATGVFAKFLRTAGAQDGLKTLYSTIGQIGSTLRSGLAAILPELLTGLKNLAPALPGLAAAIVGAAKALSPLLPVIGELARIVAEVLTVALSKLTELLTPVISKLVEWGGKLKGFSVDFGSLFDGFLEKASVFRPVIDQLGPALDKFVGMVKSIAEAAKKYWALMGDDIIAFAKRALDNFLLMISGVVEVLGGFFDVISAFFSGDYAKLWEGLKSIASGALKIVRSIFDQIGNVFLLLYQAIAAGVRKGYEQITSFLSNLATTIYEQGKNLIQSLIRGILQSVPGLQSALNSVKQYLPDWLTGSSGSSAANFASSYSYDGTVGGSTIYNVKNEFKTDMTTDMVALGATIKKATSAHDRLHG